MTITNSKQYNKSKFYKHFDNEGKENIYSCNTYAINFTFLTMKNKRKKIEEIANLIEEWKSLNRSVQIKEIYSNGVTLAVAYLVKAVQFAYAFLNCSKRLKDMARRISILLL